MTDVVHLVCLFSQENGSFLLEKSNSTHQCHHEVVYCDEKEASCHIVPVGSISPVDFEENCQNEQTNYYTLTDSRFTSLWISHNTAVGTPNQVFELRHHWCLFVVVYIELGVLERFLLLISYIFKILVVAVVKELDFFDFFGILWIVNCKFSDVKISWIMSRRARDSYFRKISSAF